ncbi:hypothetical protein AJ80_05499 [Polytolypa hystricis UAMH7299]|uniref:Condensation domain-containing protein n=1 Tax=Polytolypa hystricis (strain UAMH7299) TaxID=1447883 RepID=A0A2B7Y3R0_POLH7|nr:hypothetical protein AJ80_05499 [Polytolypa hystricis UAMH7299]
MGSAPELPPLPPLTEEFYNWEQDSTDPSVWRRRGTGAECVVGMKQANQIGANDMYLLFSFQLNKDGITLNTLEDTVRSAWITLRSQHPEVALTASWDEMGTVSLQHTEPKDDNEVREWAARTVKVEASTRTAMDIRDANEEKRRSTSIEAEAVVVYLAAPVADKTVVLRDETLHLVFHANHLYLDGISFRHMAGEFFRGLASQLSIGPSVESVSSWKKGLEYLSPPVLSLRKPNQQTSGPEFDKSAQLGGMNMLRMMNNWGLDVLGAGGFPRAVFHEFTEVESNKINKAVKDQLGPDFSITYLAHAAILLALLKTKPATDAPDGQIYGSYSAVNGRRFIRDEYAQGEKLFYPICQTSTPIIFENIKSYDMVNADKVKQREYLISAAKVAKAGYDGAINLPSYMPANTAQLQFIAALTASGNVPSTGLTTPYFTSDGVNERFIPREVFTDDGQQKTLTVQTVRFLLNQYITFMGLRLESFRGKNELSVHFNEASYTKEVAQKFVDDAAAFMLSFAE